MANPWIIAVLSAAFFPLLILFFQPSLLELLGFYLVDALAFLVVRRYDIRLFHHFYPLTQGFFPDLDPSLYTLSDTEQRRRIYIEAQRFPLRRSLYVLGVSSVKVIPGFIYLFFAWGHQETFLSMLAKGASICAFTFAFPVGMCFLQYHNHVSQSLRRLHEKCNWSDVFRSDETSLRISSFRQFELLSIGSVWLFWVFILILIIGTQQSQTMAIAQTLYVSILGIVFIGGILIVGRKQVTDGISHLVEYHQTSLDKLNPIGIALSTYPVLASYQKSLNQLIERNIASEQEIHRWILRRAEDHRYMDLGHITGLMVHDLVTPLTVMRHCLSSMEEKAETGEDQSRYVERMRFCLNQITDLVINVRSSIRDKAHGMKQASPELAHKTALKLVSYLHEGKASHRIKVLYNIDSPLSVTMPQPELNQIFLNLYSNTFQNFISHDIQEGIITIELLDLSQDFVTIGFRDNGTGLAPRAFHFITEETEPFKGSEGIGLKLTKRLVELYGGLLTVDELQEEGSGTHFHLSLRRYKPEHLNLTEGFPRFDAPGTGQARPPAPYLT